VLLLYDRRKHSLQYCQSTMKMHPTRSMASTGTCRILLHNFYCPPVHWVDAVHMPGVTQWLISTDARNAWERYSHMLAAAAAGAKDVGATEAPRGPGPGATVRHALGAGAGGAAIRPETGPATATNDCAVKPGISSVRPSNQQVRF
jgi:hypothetical protein